MWTQLYVVEKCLPNENINVAMLLPFLCITKFKVHGMKSPLTVILKILILAGASDLLKSIKTNWFPRDWQTPSLIEAIPRFCSSAHFSPAKLKQTKPTAHRPSLSYLPVFHIVSNSSGQATTDHNFTLRQFLLLPRPKKCIANKGSSQLHNLKTLSLALASWCGSVGWVSSRCTQS